MSARSGPILAELEHVGVGVADEQRAARAELQLLAGGRRASMMRGTMRHLFLDLDGTLTDPAPGIGACFVHAARVLGHTSISETEVRSFIGPPLRDVFRQILGTDDVLRIEEAVGIYRERFGSVGLFENSVYPGVPDALAGLRQAGHRLCVVTSKAAVYANRIIDHFGLRELLPHVYGAELSGERSTKAELIAHALEAERLAPTEACMVGDREHDIIGAKANGTSSIGVTWGYGSRAELEAAGADRVVDTLQELITAASSLTASVGSR